ncbi:Possible hemagglutinin (DUF638) [Cedecea lapagei]|uniref:Possible hemagglutinin (DUF638) n=1 Tax=Cedecea lapagei TaxID=158823 RepID=A0A3S4J2G0_9ENTR|nr:VENN motif pre-toxin domain-containing protein [Cedecea lapagei]VEB97017.1 Possible hemagglutinin (DUF638) [Cedecea lapagei]
MSFILAGGLNPVMAQAIKSATTRDNEVNEPANLMVHAFSGELAARHIAAEMFPGKDPGNLIQDQKQLVSLLGTMAAGIAGGVVGNSTAAATTGAQAGKNAVENNRLSNPKEKQIINNLVGAGYDPQKMEAASCALVKCYAEYPVGSAEYEKNLALAQKGENYKEEQNLLKNYELLTTELKDPLYWNKVPEEVKQKYQGFTYSQSDKIEDGQKAYDAWKIAYIADKLNIPVSAVRLTDAGLNIALNMAATSSAGKIAGNNPSKKNAAQGNEFVAGTKIDNSLNLIDKEVLPDALISTFKGGQYETVITREPVSVYRNFGGSETLTKLDGGFATTTFNAGRNETAVYKKCSTTQFEAELEIPKGIKLNVGHAGEQPPRSTDPKYTGGADQILLPRSYPTEWIKSIRDGKTGQVYSYDEFKSKFPEQVTRGQ